MQGKGEKMTRGYTCFTCKTKHDTDPPITFGIQPLPFCSRKCIYEYFVTQIKDYVFEGRDET